MPNQRDQSKKQVGLYVRPEIKAAIQKLGVEEATSVEILLIDALIRNKLVAVSKVEEMASKGQLRSGTVIWMRSNGALKDPVGKAS